MLAKPDASLLISGFGDDTGGGLFCFDGDQLDQLDDLSTTGLNAFDGHLARLLRTGTDEEAPGELLIYDMHGLQRYHRNSLVDAHDIIRWADGSFAVASPASNRIVWVSPSGEIVRTWRTPGRGDAWHVNGLLQQDGDLYVCPSANSRATVSGRSELTDTGFVRNLTRHRDVVTGLSAPHDPRFFDGRWWVCNSGRRELLQLDPKGLHVERRLQLQGWTRGLAIGDDLLFVGENSNRRAVVRRAMLTASIGDSLPANALMDLECIVENRGSATFVSIPPCPVNISYTWLHVDSGRPVSSRAPLPRPLPAGDRLVFPDRHPYPGRGGGYELRLASFNRGSHGSMSSTAQAALCIEFG